MDTKTVALHMAHVIQTASHFHETRCKGSRKVMIPLMHILFLYPYFFLVQTIKSKHQTPIQLKL